MNTEERLAETLAIIEETERAGDEVILNPQWVKGLRRALRERGFALRFWRGVHNDIEGGWVTVTRSPQPVKIVTCSLNSRLAHDEESLNARCQFCDRWATYWSQAEKLGGQRGGPVIYHCQAHRAQARVLAGQTEKIVKTEINLFLVEILYEDVEVDMPTHFYVLKNGGGETVARYDFESDRVLEVTWYDPGLSVPQYLDVPDQDMTEYKNWLRNALPQRLGATSLTVEGE